MATLDPVQFNALKTIHEQIQKYLIPDGVMLIDLIPITAKTAPDDVSRVYRQIMEQMQVYSRSIVGLRSLAATLRGKINIAAAMGTEQSHDLLKMKPNLDRLISTADGHAEAYTMQYNTLQSMAKYMQNMCYMYGARVAPM